MTTATAIIPAPTTITIEGIELPIKATPLGKITKALPYLNDGFSTPESVEELAAAIFHGIRRAGGQVTLEWINDNIDLNNVESLLDTFLRVNHMKPASADGKVEQASA